MSGDELLVLSIAAGIVISFVFSEIHGLAAGGVVVPGYVALYLHRPYVIALTMAVAVGTFAIVKVLSTFLIIYGRRRTSVTLLIGFALGAWLSHFGWLPESFGLSATDISVIGFIIPALIAIWFDRQGIVQTTASLAIAAVLVRIFLLLVVGATALEEAP